MKKKIMINTLFTMGLVFYMVFLLSIIVFKYVSPLELFSTDRYFSRTINLIPFNDIMNGYYNKMDILGNIILFIPLGIYINILVKDIKLSLSIGYIMGISLIMECTQYIFGIGASDITDLITNTIGGIMGMGIYVIIKKIFKDNNKVKRCVTVYSTLVMIPVAIILIGLAIVN